MSALQSLLLCVSIYMLFVCMINLLERTLQTHHWFCLFKEISKKMRQEPGLVDTELLAKQFDEIAWDMLARDRNRTFWGRKWVRKYKRDKLFEEADRIVGVPRK